MCLIISMYFYLYSPTGYFIAMIRVVFFILIDTSPFFCVWFSLIRSRIKEFCDNGDESYNHNKSNTEICPRQTCLIIQARIPKLFDYFSLPSYL